MLLQKNPILPVMSIGSFSVNDTKLESLYTQSAQVHTSSVFIMKYQSSSEISAGQETDGNGVRSKMLFHGLDIYMFWKW